MFIAGGQGLGKLEVKSTSSKQRETPGSRGAEDHRGLPRGASPMVIVGRTHGEQGVSIKCSKAVPLLIILRWLQNSESLYFTSVRGALLGG